MSFLQIGAANLVGIVIYLATCLAAIATAFRVTNIVRYGRVTWLVVAVIFLGLALFRVVDGEEAMRQSLRGYLLAENEYQGRRTLQAGVAIACVALAGLSALWALIRFAHWPRWRLVIAASIGSLGLVYALRIISLHNVDRLLYASLGPVHINHALELLPIAAIWHSGWMAHRYVSSRSRR